MSFYPRPMQGVDRTGAVEKLASDDEGDSSVELDEQMKEWLSIDPNIDEEDIATYAPNDMSGGEMISWMPDDSSDGEMATDAPNDSTDQEMATEVPNDSTDQEMATEVPNDSTDKEMGGVNMKM
ncbi:hypothetical protein NXS19_008471 [Fusarium pseudograminearum]|nr:hypothetical protein NXS19_008471 [Fusarium pseudograminearum]